jgi:hypothetical protein
MKKTFLAVIAILSALPFVSYAQTNTLPTSGNVGIGTTSPVTTLQVSSSSGNGVVIGTTAYPSWLGTNGLYIDGNIRANNYYFNNGSAINWGASQARIIGVSPSTGANTYLSFYTGGIAAQGERMRIIDDGKIGIGTTSPNDLLEVNGNIRISDNISGSILKRANAISTLFESKRTDDTRAGLLRTNGWGDFSFNNSVGIGYDLSTSPNMTGGLFVSSQLGIGTTSPVSMFQVRSGSSKASIGSAGDVNSDVLHFGTSYFGMNAARYYNGSTTSQSWALNGDNYSNGAGVIYGSVLGDLYFATIPSIGGADRVLSDADIAGHVALKISASGVVYTKELNVQTNIFPDYVFQKDYRLRPLAEVQAYIDQNHHLPEIPSEQEVIKNGLNLGEMNKLLLKKVEELTLYLIQQQEEINMIKRKQEESNAKKP